jgi:tripartite-type tricarboxylate transporter receptor subunit TctC
MDRRHFLTVAGAAASTLAAPALAQAPAGRPIRIIVPFAAGGAIDVTARLMAEKASAQLGTIVIENRPGGGGGIGVDMVAKAAPDGLTIGIAAVAMHAINPWLFGKLPYDPIKDFAPITQMVRIPNVLVMNADTAKRLNIKTLKDFLCLCQGQPGQAELRQRRQRQRRPPGRRDVQGQGGLLCGAHPLQRRRALAAGAAVGHGGLHAGQPGHLGANIRSGKVCRWR